MTASDPSSTSQTRRLRDLPRVDQVLATEPVATLARVRGPGLLTHHVRQTLDELRRALSSGAPVGEAALSAGSVAERAARRATSEFAPLPRVLNGTGVILHSGLGRAPIPERALDAVRAAAGYSLLEVDRAAGERLARDTRTKDLLRALTGASDSLVVNNCAAATVLILTGVAHGREVICSRGEMVEIGGSFRIPEVMEASGAKLVSVGATNHTYARDYDKAITPNTAALLVVHTSNYRIHGFTSTPPLEEIVALGHARGIPVIHDLGSGSFLTPAELGFGDEPPVSKSIQAGADLVCMSGDKMLGGPQAGIILGSEEWVPRLRRHPLARALRVDKMTVAALNATLELFFDRARLLEHHPVARMLMTPVDELRGRAEQLAQDLRSIGLHAEVVPTEAETGSGALPTVKIPSLGVALSGQRGSVVEFARRLRGGDPALFTRTIKDRIYIDVRTLFPAEDAEVRGCVLEAMNGSSSP